MKSIPKVLALESRDAPATFTVTTLADSGAGSLRAALAAADALPGPDRIVFKLPAPAAHSENTITLTSGELTSKGNVTISGPGAGKLIIDAANNSRVFDIDDGNLATDSPTTISGLSIIRGKINGFGGGVYSAESLTLNNVVVSQCSANTGGGVAVEGGGSPPETVSISNSFVTNNSASNVAGGIDMDRLKSISIQKTVVTGNTSTFLVGGIYAYTRSTGTGIAITGCTIESNSALVVAGGLELRNNATSPKAKTIVSQTIIAENSSTSAGSFGGAVFLRSGNALITGSTIQNNSAGYYGGGVAASSLASLTISRSTIASNRTTAENSTSDGGGGIFISGSGPATPEPVSITGSTIAGNVSAGGGGGLLATGGIALSISGTTITGNHAAFKGGGAATAGTGVKLVNLVVNGGTISGNSAGDFGGGLSAAGDGKISITSTTITGNTSAKAGGGMYLSSSAATHGVVLKNLTVSSNTAGGAWIGGGVFIFATTDFHILGGLFTKNVANDGGAIAVQASGVGSILGVTATDNAATALGGAIANYSGAVSVQAAKISGNTAPNNPDFYGLFTYL
jgi:hypothetical protein